LLAALVLVGIGVGGAVLTMLKPWWLPPLASHWADIDAALLNTIVVSGVVFVVLHLVLGAAVFLFRRREGHKAKHWHESHKLEKVLIAGVAAGIIAMLAPAFRTYGEFIEPPEDAIEVDVLGEQWRWAYRFPGADGKFGRIDPRKYAIDNLFGLDLDDPAAADDVLVQGFELLLPVDTNVSFRIRAKDVLHSYYLPEFRIKMDAVPGIVTQAWARTTKLGDFQVLCAELCGTNHFLMRSRVRVVDAQTFSEWLAGQPTAVPAPAQTAAAQVEPAPSAAQ
jgi:cytochrome c oxidase subunit 2